MDNAHHPSSEYNLTALMQVENNHPSKIKLIDYINTLTENDFTDLSLQSFLTEVIHLTAQGQNENIFWLTYSVCESAKSFKITEQKNKLGDRVIHTLMRYPHSSNLLEGLLSHEPLLIGQLNDFQETPLHIFLNSLAFNPICRENLLQPPETHLFRFLDILSQPFLYGETTTSNLIRYDKKGYAPIQLCALYGLENELDYLLTQFQTLVDFPTAKNKTCLHLAANQGHIGIIDILIKHKANLEITTLTKNNNALHIAAQKGHLLVCKKIMQKLPELADLKNKQNLTPLQLAKQHHRHDCYELLLEHENQQAVLNHHQSFTPIYTQSENSDRDIVPVFSDKELTLNTYLMGITLGYEIAYQKIPEGKLIAIKNELNQTHLYAAHQLYHSSGLISYIFIPFKPNLDELIEIYVTFQGTNDTDALHRDLEDKGPGYQSYKQKEPDLIAKFFDMISPFFHTHTNKISITLAGHSLGGGDSFYFLQSLLKIIAQHSVISYDKSLFTEKLIADKTMNANDDIMGIINQTEKLLLEKPLIKILSNINNITRTRIIALNPVGLPKSIDHALEGVSRYLKNRLIIDSFVLRSEGDFAQRMSDRVPLCDIPAQYVKVNFLLAPGDPFAIQKASACYFGATSLNPRDTSANFINIGTDMAMLGTFGCVTLGPLGLLIGLAAGGARLYTSDKLKQWGKQMALKPHSHLLPENSAQDLSLLEKVTLIDNTTPESCAQIRDIGHNLNTSTFERYVTEKSKQELAKNLNYSFF